MGWQGSIHPRRPNLIFIGLGIENQATYTLIHLRFPSALFGDPLSPPQCGPGKGGEPGGGHGDGPVENCPSGGLIEGLLEPELEAA